MDTLQQLHLPTDRNERRRYIKQVFPHAAGSDLQGEWAGGRAMALQRLAKVDGIDYGRSRNFLEGNVTRLSPYLRHGCLTLKEALLHVQEKFGRSAEKLLFEFAWRDYWRQVWQLHGDAIRSDMEPPKVALSRLPLPTDVTSGNTGLPCMDAFVHQLLETGYIHNHARMWFAAYVVHWRKVDWRAAADWFEAQLLDGDKASNSLSWQWVASTFGAKPYFFNKENLAKYSAEKYCRDCRVQCPFDNSYEALDAQLFTKTSAPARVYKRVALPDATADLNPTTHNNCVVLMHDEMLSPAHDLNKHDAQKIAVFDTHLHGHWALHRLQFMADCLNEMPDVDVYAGDTRQVLRSLGVQRVITQTTPNPTIQALLASFTVEYHAEPVFADVNLMPQDLRRLSKYWQKVGPVILAGDPER